MVYCRHSREQTNANKPPTACDVTPVKDNFVSQVFHDKAAGTILFCLEDTTLKVQTIATLISFKSNTVNSSLNEHTMLTWWQSHFYYRGRNDVTLVCIFVRGLFTEPLHITRHAALHVTSSTCVRHACHCHHSIEAACRRPVSAACRPLLLSWQSNPFIKCAAAAGRDH